MAVEAVWSLSAFRRLAVRDGRRMDNGQRTIRHASRAVDPVAASRLGMLGPAAELLWQPHSPTIDSMVRAPSGLGVGTLPTAHRKKRWKVGHKQPPTMRHTFPGSRSLRTLRTTASTTHGRTPDPGCRHRTSPFCTAGDRRCAIAIGAMPGIFNWPTGWCRSGAGHWTTPSAGESLMTEPAGLLTCCVGGGREGHRGPPEGHQRGTAPPRRGARIHPESCRNQPPAQHRIRQSDPGSSTLKLRR